MKKMNYMAAMAIAAATLASCGTGTPNANLSSDVDSLSYAAGVSLAKELKQYNLLEQQFGVDSAYINDFVKGVQEAVNAADDKKKAAYFAGLQIGNQLSSQIMPNMMRSFFGDDSTKNLSKNNLMAAFTEVLTGKDAKLTDEQVEEIQKRFSSIQQELQMAKQQEEMKKRKAERWEKADKDNAEKYAAYKAQNEKFLADNAKKDGVKTTASGLQYKVIKEGDGEKPTTKNYVKVNYEGKTIDGKVFDSSYERNQAATFGLTQVIEGWTEVLQLMPVGSTYEVYIPQNLAYGPEEQEKIKPYSTLIFKVELLDIVQ